MLHRICDALYARQAHAARIPKSPAVRSRSEPTGALIAAPGNKLINVPPAKLKSGDERVIAVASVPERGELVLYCGQRKLILKPADLDAYAGKRAARGNMLPRGFQRVDAVQVEAD